jgi:hypothetical protein
MKLIKSKTFWTGVASIATGVAFVVSGDVGTGAQTILGGFTAIFLRSAVKK